jgi:hypothetical protein
VYDRLPACEYKIRFFGCSTVHTTTTVPSLGTVCLPGIRILYSRGARTTGSLPPRAGATPPPHLRPPARDIHGVLPQSVRQRLLSTSSPAFGSSSGHHIIPMCTRADRQRPLMVRQTAPACTHCARAGSSSGLYIGVSVCRQADTRARTKTCAQDRDSTRPSLPLAKAARLSRLPRRRWCRGILKCVCVCACARA